MVEPLPPRRRRGRLVLILVLSVALFVAGAAAAGWWAWAPSYRPALASDESYGVDVSAHQGAIDWPRVRADHIEFAYIKATEGAEFVDSRFAANWSAAQQAGLRVGAYHFFSLCAAGMVQAQHFLAAVPVVGAALPAAVDLALAGNCRGRPDSGAVNEQVAMFAYAVEQQTHQPIVVYASASFAHRYPLSSLADHPRWIRRLLIHPSERFWSIWQASDRAHVTGIHGSVDLDVRHVAGKNGVEALGSFAGSWGVHGAEMNINRDGTGTQTIGLGTCPRADSRHACYEVNRLSFTLASDRTTLTGHVVAVTYHDETGAVPTSWITFPTDAVGDSFQLRFAQPLLLRTTYVTSHLPAEDLKAGNPYWCGLGISQQTNNHYCNF